MSFKTINITVIENYRYELIICIEYVNVHNPDNKLLKIIRSREFENNLINVFDFDNIPDDIQKIYDYSKTVSKYSEKNGIYYIYGQKIHKRDNKYYKLIYDDVNPFVNIDINNTNLNCISIEDAYYYYRVLCTIKLKCY